MDYRKLGECYYIRMDRDDEIISRILEICKKENIRSAVFYGIGGCKDAEIQTFIPETGSFEEQYVSGMLGLKPIKTLPIREKIAANLREAILSRKIPTGKSYLPEIQERLNVLKLQKKDTD